jgi:hypothetical protein
MSEGPFQLVESEIFRPVDDPTGTTHWMYIADVEDDSVAQAAFDATIPSFYLGSPQQDYRAKYLGNYVYMAEVHYGLVPPLSIGTTVWEIDTTPSREKIFQSLSTRFQQRAHTGDPIIDFGGAIGQTADKIEGVDAYVGGMKMTAKRRYIQANFASNYIQSLAEQLCHPPRVNMAVFSFVWQGQTYTFQAGEVLFLGAHGTTVDQKRVEIDHEFLISFNRLVANGNGITLQGFDAQVSKMGWDYGWIAYETKSSGGIRMVQKPTQFNSEGIYPPADFTILQI